MNNIASPRRIDLAGLGARVSRQGLTTAIATLLLSVIMISFRPFAPDGGGVVGGDIVNQIGFSVLGAVSLFCLFSFVDRRVLAALLSPWWLVLLALFLLSVVNAADPPSAFRTASFTLIGILTVTAILTLPRDADAFSTVLIVAGLLVVGLSYLGLVLYPDVARHTTDSLEPEHAGMWRGVFSHKNVAAPVMAGFSFAGLYVFRRGWRRSGAVLFMAAMVFLYNTGSKTTAGLVPLAIILVMGPGLIGMRKAVPFLFGIGMAAVAVGTIGIVMSDTLWKLSQTISPGLTYTGRTSLWEFLLEMIAKKPWTGYGYESFWGTPFLFTQDQPFDRDWDIRGIVHGHNGYLDIAVLMGIPTLAVAVVTFLVVPMRDFWRVPHRRENVLVADLYMMILMFTALNAFLESFFFRRADPVWLLFVLATFGLRLTARFPVRTRAPD